jgi:K+-sensing histidine kinase KdpD
MKEKFAKLIDVKTVVTFTITAVFAYLAVTGTIPVDQFMIVAIMIYTYFFTKKGDKDVT